VHEAQQHHIETHSWACNEANLQYPNPSFTPNRLLCICATNWSSGLWLPAAITIRCPQVGELSTCTVAGVTVNTNNRKRPVPSLRVPQPLLLLLDPTTPTYSAATWYVHDEPLRALPSSLFYSTSVAPQQRGKPDCIAVTVRAGLSCSCLPGPSPQRVPCARIDSSFSCLRHTRNERSIDYPYYSKGKLAYKTPYLPPVRHH
jgi:hypothetical protein